MDDLDAIFCDLPVELKVLVLSHIEHVEPPHILALSSDVWEALSLLRALQRTSYFDGVPGDFADHLVHLLDDDRVRSLEKERALELIGDENKDRLCEYACGRNFEVLKWAHNELDLPWAPYPAGRVGDDVLVLRVLRGTSSKLQQRWREDVVPEEWHGVRMVDGRVVVLQLQDLSLCAVPGEVGRLSALRELELRSNQLASVPAEIGQLTSLLGLHLSRNELTGLPAEIGQLTSLTELALRANKLTSVPAVIWQLTSLEELGLGDNYLTSVPAEIEQLTSLVTLDLSGNQLASVPAEFGQLTSLTRLWLQGNQLTSLPAEFWQLTSLTRLWLQGNQLTSLPAAIRELRATGCDVQMDDDVTVDE